ncbi:hypothetical protein D039_0476B, partial [Vibrio parahaemolyticus EKP-028]
ARDVVVTNQKQVNWHVL